MTMTIDANYGFRSRRNRYVRALHLGGLWKEIKEKQGKLFSPSARRRCLSIAMFQRACSQDEGTKRKNHVEPAGKRFSPDLRLKQ